MKIFYWKSPIGNFGDDLNDWIWDQLLPGWQDWDDATTLVGVGTILNSTHFPPDKPGRFLVAGSGMGYGDKPDTGDRKRWDIRSLRGPRSARALGLPESLGIIDPAIMLSEMDEFRDLPRAGKAIFIPHLSSVNRYDWPKICAQAGIDFVSPCDESRSVVRRIAMAPLVLAESMHAAIIADTFRVPWIPLSLSKEFNSEKWLDWSDSLGMSLTVRPLLAPVLRLEKFRHKKVKLSNRPVLTQPVANTHTPSKMTHLGRQAIQKAVENYLIVPALRSLMNRRTFLSSEDVLRRQKERYQSVLDAITRDYSRCP